MVDFDGGIRHLSDDRHGKAGKTLGDQEMRSELAAPTARSLFRAPALPMGAASLDALQSTAALCPAAGATRAAAPTPDADPNPWQCYVRSDPCRATRARCAAR